MAAALGLRIAGPRVYAGHTVADAWMGDGRAEVGPEDIRRAIALAWRVWWLLARAGRGGGTASPDPASHRQQPVEVQAALEMPASAVQRRLDAAPRRPAVAPARPRIRASSAARIAVGGEQPVQVAAHHAAVRAHRTVACRRRAAASGRPGPARPSGPCGSRSPAPPRPVAQLRASRSARILAGSRTVSTSSRPRPAVSPGSTLEARADRRCGGRASGSRRTGPAPSRRAAHGPGCRCPSRSAAAPRGRPGSTCCRAAARDRSPPAAARPAPARAGRRRARPRAGRDRRNWPAAADCGTATVIAAPLPAADRRQLGQAQHVLLGQVARLLEPGHHAERPQAGARLDHRVGARRTARGRRGTC